MNLWSNLSSLTARLFRRDSVAEDLEQELAAHIALRADDLVRSGFPRAEAERRARIEFGAREHYREESFAALGGEFVDTTLRDLRHAFRTLRKSPGFTVAAVITLAMAIGANALVFGLLNALILRPLNVPQPDSFYALDSVGPLQYFSYPQYEDLRDRNRSFSGLSAENIAAAAIDTGNNPSPAWLIEVSGNYFDTVGIQPYLGRFFHASDERGPDSAPYIVLSHAYWQTHFQGDRNVIGRTVQLNKHPFTIIGVAQPSFIGSLLIFRPDFWIPIVNQPMLDGGSILTDRGNHWVSGAMARLKPGVTVQQATADLNAIRLDLNRAYPAYENKEPSCLVRPGLGGNFLGPAITAFIGGLMLLAVLILLAACANLGSLFAARASDRAREVALRLALGARRTRILRQLFTEAILVSLAGGAVGLLGSMILLRSLSTWHPFPEFPLNIPVTPDAKVYLFALLMALLSGFLFGAVPVRQVLRTDPYQIVKNVNAGAKSGRRVSARDVLLVTQIAICAILVTASMVAVRGLLRTLHVYTGFDPNNVLLANTSLGMAGYTGDRVPAMQRNMIEAVETIPGVRQVSIINSPPLHMGWDTTTVFSDATTDFRPSNAAASPVSYNVMPGYFETAGTALVAGRQLAWNDDGAAPRVAMVNAEFARKVFGSPQAAINHDFKLRDGTRIQVVGVVEDGKYTANLAEDRQAALFRPLLQYHVSDSWLVIRSSRDPQQLAAEVRDRLRKLDPGLPVFTQTWNTSMNGAFFASRVATVSLGILGAMGAILSITGIFGMAAYSVSRRLKEIGIRVALGARRSVVLRTAVGRAFNLLSLGSAAGLILGFLASRVLASIVYEATPRDPFVLAGVVLAMALLGLFATWIPAQRALSVNPLELLRED
ncbi:MAG TPA: ABC transporter permease [Terracidiphilus sp.]|jgi:predicted permease